MSELIDALNMIEKEKEISKEIMIEAIEQSLIAACKKDYGNYDNFRAHMDAETGEISLFAEKTVVAEVEDDNLEISIEEAKLKNLSYEPGDVVNVEMTPSNFNRIAAQQARSVIVQKIKEEERNAVFKHFSCKQKDVVTGVVQRYDDKGNVRVSLDEKTEASLNEKEQVKTEHFRPQERIKLYIVDVKTTNKGPKILVSRTHPELVKRLFEQEVTEVADGTVEIRSIAREAGSRTKIAVYSNDENVDPVGACVGVNGSRVNNIVDDLKGEKIDIITWDEDPAIYIKNALSPSDVVSVIVDLDEKSARVVVPDQQLSLAIGKEGQNARLAARLTGYKIDIKSESQAEELGDYLDDMEDMPGSEESIFDDMDDYDGDDFDAEDIAENEEDAGDIAGDEQDDEASDAEEEA